MNKAETVALPAALQETCWPKQWNSGLMFIFHVMSIMRKRGCRNMLWNRGKHSCAHSRRETQLFEDHGMRWYKILKISPSLLLSQIIDKKSWWWMSVALCCPGFSPLCFPCPRCAPPDVSHPPSWLAGKLPQLQAVGWWPYESLWWS